MNYRMGRTYADFQNSTFVPVFLSDFNQTAIDAAELECNSTTDKPCIFDFLATSSSAVAQLTKQVEIDNKIKSEELGKIKTLSIVCCLLFLCYIFYKE